MIRWVQHQLGQVACAGAHKMSCVVASVVSLNWLIGPGCYGCLAGAVSSMDCCIFCIADFHLEEPSRSNQLTGQQQLL